MIARLMMLETVRNTMVVVPGSPPAPASPGPATSLTLDLLAGVPALLLLVRRWVDGRFSLRRSWSMLPMAALAVWAVLSTLWSSDKFAALVSSLHLAAAFAALWAASQLVRSWLRLRIVAGVCFGMLLVLVAHSAYFLLAERPELRAMWEENPDEILRQRGITPGTFEALQFKNKILGGELMGFSASPNTYAALAVLTMIVAAGVAIDRTMSLVRARVAGSAVEGERRSRNSRVVLAAVAITVAVAVAPAYWAIAMAQSRTAFATPLLAFAALGGLAVWGRKLAAHAKRAYWAGVAAVAAVAMAVVGHGIAHGSLVHESLSFRWRYWVGSLALFKLHPLLGVGWENFGPHYLLTRLPTATEEIRDPHNFVVRFFVELGVVGGLLMLAWMLRLWWEMTRPGTVVPVDAIDASGKAVTGTEGRPTRPTRDVPSVALWPRRLVTTRPASSWSPRSRSPGCSSTPPRASTSARSAGTS